MQGQSILSSPFPWVKVSRNEKQLRGKTLGNGRRKEVADGLVELREKIKKRKGKGKGRWLEITRTLPTSKSAFGSLPGYPGLPGTYTS